ncbi:MAG: hypothetical protein ACI9G1_005659, partial [Pirellulaceae bacterium]
MSTTDSQSPRRKKKQPAPSPVANEHAHEDEGVADEGAADEGAEAKEYVRTPIYSRYRRIVDFFGAWSVSIIVHVILLVILGIWALPEIIKEHVRTLVVVRMEEDLDDEEEFVEVELEKTVEAVEQVSLAVMSSNPVVVGAEGSVSDAAA